MDNSRETGSDSTIAFTSAVELNLPQNMLDFYSFQRCHSCTSVFLKRIHSPATRLKAGQFLLRTQRIQER